MKPWMVGVIVLGCFAVLYPKIFHPMFKQLFFGSQRDAIKEAEERARSLHPAARARGISPHEARTVMSDGPRNMNPGMHAADMRARAMQGSQKEGGGGRGGMMGTLLPVYAVGIVLYLVYILSKVFGGDSKKGDKDAYDQKATDKLSEVYRQVQYSPRHNEFRYNPDDDESDLDGLDEDYKIYVKKRRREKELERLVLKADSDTGNMSMAELRQLQERLLETEQQMRTIMGAMKNVGSNINDVQEQVVTNGKKKRTHRLNDEEHAESLSTEDISNDNTEQSDQFEDSDDQGYQFEDQEVNSQDNEDDECQEEYDSRQYKCEKNNLSDLEAELAECDHIYSDEQESDNIDDGDGRVEVIRPRDDVEEALNIYHENYDKSSDESVGGKSFDIRLTNCDVGNEEEDVDNVEIKDLLDDGVRQRRAVVTQEDLNSE